jgi:oligopeptide/dipeptide ABC transporter ATP-binding protein
MSLLAVDNLTLTGPAGAIVEGLSFTLKAGEALCLSGPSGSGKTLTALALLRLLPPGITAHGRITLAGLNILAADDPALRRLRGRTAGFVFQDQAASLDPLMTAGQHIAQALALHGVPRAERRPRIAALLGEVGLDPALERRYPDRLAGGERQRLAIAIALANEPQLLIADEPTTALDVTVQAQILDLMKDLAADLGTTVVLVTHDLGVVASLCDRVIVLYGGRIMESGPAEILFEDPKHPYTRGLLASTPRLDEENHGELHTIPGQPPAVAKAALGCPFEPRCEFREPRCKTVRPIIQDNGQRTVACHVVSL